MKTSPNSDNNNTEKSPFGELPVTRDDAYIEQDPHSSELRRLSFQPSNNNLLSDEENASNQPTFTLIQNGYDTNGKAIFKLITTKGNETNEYELRIPGWKKTIIYTFLKWGGRAAVASEIIYALFTYYASVSGLKLFGKTILEIDDPNSAVINILALTFTLGDFLVNVFNMTPGFDTRSKTSMIKVTKDKDIKNFPERVGKDLGLKDNDLRKFAKTISVDFTAAASIASKWELNLAGSPIKPAAQTNSRLAENSPLLGEKSQPPTPPSPAVILMKMLLRGALKTFAFISFWGMVGYGSQADLIPLKNAEGMPSWYQPVPDFFNDNLTAFITLGSFTYALPVIYYFLMQYSDSMEGGEKLLDILKTVGTLALKNPALAFVALGSLVTNSIFRGTGIGFIGHDATKIVFGSDSHAFTLFNSTFATLTGTAQTFYSREKIIGAYANPYNSLLKQRLSIPSILEIRNWSVGNALWTAVKAFPVPAIRGSLAYLLTHHLAQDLDEPAALTLGIAVGIIYGGLHYYSNLKHAVIENAAPNTESSDFPAAKNIPAKAARYGGNALSQAARILISSNFAVVLMKFGIKDPYTAFALALIVSLDGAMSNFSYFDKCSGQDIEDAANAVSSSVVKGAKFLGGMFKKCPCPIPTNANYQPLGSSPV